MASGEMLCIPPMSSSLSAVEGWPDVIHHLLPSTAWGQKHHPLFVGYRGEAGIGRRTDQRPGRFPLPGSSSKKYSRIQVKAARRVGSGLQVACAVHVVEPEWLARRAENWEPVPSWSPQPGQQTNAMTTRLVPRGIQGGATGGGKGQALCRLPCAKARVPVLHDSMLPGI